MRPTVSGWFIVMLIVAMVFNILLRVVWPPWSRPLW